MSSGEEKKDTGDATSSPMQQEKKENKNDPETEEEVTTVTDDKDDESTKRKKMTIESDQEQDKKQKLTEVDEKDNSNKENTSLQSPPPPKKQKSLTPTEEKLGKGSIDEGGNSKTTSTKNDIDGDNEGEDQKDSESPPTKQASEEEMITKLKPIKKAKTAYFLFMEEKRPEFAAAHPGESVGFIAKLTGQAWSALDDEQKAKYQEKAAEDKQRVSKEVQEFKTKYNLTDEQLNKLMNSNSPSGGDDSHSPDNLILPIGRIRKITKLDPDVKGMSKESITLVTKCAELFLSKLGREAVKVASIQNRRKLLADDIVQVCSTQDPMLFLRDDIKDIALELKEQQQAAENNKKNADNKDEDNKGGDGNQKLTSFFGSATTKTITATSATITTTTYTTN